MKFVRCFAETGEIVMVPLKRVAEIQRVERDDRDEIIVTTDGKMYSCGCDAMTVSGSIVEV